MTRPRILVTGAGGFIGRHALAPLAAAGAVVGTGRRPPAPAETSAEAPALAEASAGIAWHAADLLDADDRRALVAAVRPTHLLHLAWVTEHGKFWDAESNRDWAAATRDLVERCLDAGCGRVVMGGTCAEYDWTDPGLADGVADERLSPCRPAFLYGRAKLETAAWLFERLGDRAATGRLFLLHGTAESPNRLVPAVARGLLAGTPVKTGPGDGIRDFLDSRDAGAAFAALTLSAVGGPVNIASGVPVALHDVVDRVARLAGRPELVRRGALPPKSGEPPRLVAAVERLNREVGFTPRFDLDTGLAHSVDWWRHELAEARP